jgi:uncharacterized membrane protein
MELAHYQRQALQAKWETCLQSAAVIHCSRAMGLVALVVQAEVEAVLLVAQAILEELDFKATTAELLQQVAVLVVAVLVLLGRMQLTQPGLVAQGLPIQSRVHL